MRNVFDQYSQPENRVTHALMTALDEDRKLLGLFLRELVRVKAPTDPRKLSVLEQQYPGEEEPSEDDLERRGIPDGWIFDEDEGWCVLIETKVLSKLDADQITRHRRTAERRGFRNITAVAIAPILPTSFPAGSALLEWRTVYAWLRRHSSHSCWATRAADYLDIAEAKLIDTRQFVEGTLTMFLGFPFGRDHPFTYLEGRRVLGLVMGELQNRRDLLTDLGIKPKAAGKKKITRAGDTVWDILSLSAVPEEDNFTKHVHLTLAIGPQAVTAMVTVPDQVNNLTRQKLIKLGEAGFQALIEDIVKKLKPLLDKGATPWFRGVQRRWQARSGIPFVDAEIGFDLRTAIQSNGPPKMQLRWLPAGYGSFVNNENSNYEFQMGVVFHYDRCHELREREAVDLIAKGWRACKPLVDLAR